MMTQVSLQQSVEARAGVPSYQLTPPNVYVVHILGHVDVYTIIIGHKSLWPWTCTVKQHTLYVDANLLPLQSLGILGRSYLRFRSSWMQRLGLIWNLCINVL